MKIDLVSLRLSVAIAALLLSSACSPASLKLESSSTPAGAVLQPVGQQPQTPQGAPQAALPELASLPLSPRSGSYVEADLKLLGEQYDQTLPSSAVQVFNSPVLNFSPANFNATNGLKQTALAIYHFNAPGYDRDNTIYTNWTENPADPDLIWVGLANWANGRWDWYQHQPGGYVQPADLQPYFSAGGDLYLAILVTGFFQADLDNIQLGGPAPIIVYTATPQEGTAPLVVDFDASQTLPPIGLIESYEWDPEGDGTFVPGPADGHYTHTYVEAGSIEAAVRVTNTLGNSSVDSLPITVHQNWMHSFGREGIDEFTGAAIDDDGSVFLCGHSANPDNSLNYELVVLKLDSFGGLLWARRYTATGDVYAGDCALDGSGNLVVVGSQEVSGLGRECLAQKWSPDGLLQWSRSFGSADFDRLDAVECGGEDIYACGLSGGDICVLRLNSDGSLNWARTRDGGTTDFANDLALKYSIVGAVQGLSVIGSRSVASVQNVLRLDYSGAGSFQAAETFGNASVAKEGQRIKLTTDFQTLVTSYTISGTVVTGGEEQPFILDFDDSDVSTYGRRLSGTGFVEASGFVEDGTGGFYLSGWFGGENHGALLHLDQSGQLLKSLQLGAADSESRSYGLLPFQDGLLTWGNAPNAGQAWEPLALAAQTYSETWEAATTSGASLNWTAVDSLGDSFNFDDGLVIDDGAGLEDAAVSYVPLP